MNNIVNHEVVLLPIDSLKPHPLNRPATGISRDQVEILMSLIEQNGYNGSKPITVRYLDGCPYQIIEGHHRVIAATELGFAELPCVVEELDDIDANIRLLSSNQHEGNDPLDIGLNALDTVEKSKGGRGVKSELSVSGFAERLGKSKQQISGLVQAAKVFKKVSAQVDGFDSKDCAKHLTEIHSAPEWLWTAIANQMAESNCNVVATREKVKSYKDLSPPPEWADAKKIANLLIEGAMKIPEVKNFSTVVANAKVRDDDDDKLHHWMLEVLSSETPSRLSQVQQIVSEWEAKQYEKDQIEKNRKIAEQRAQETAMQRILNLRKNVSLDEWKVLSQEEQSLLLVPDEGSTGVFNKQDTKEIEWAQWSWNPVTGCKHNCSYCYARDIANSKKMEKVYPHGFAPAFRSNALNAPIKTKVPKEAEKDARYKNVFTCSMADLFGRWVPLEWINAVMNSVRENNQWDFLFLTKFPQRLSEIELPENAWMGTTVDLQARVANAEKAFEKVKCRVKWLSIEPMIEPLKFERLDLFDWVVIGGASPSENTPKWEVPFEWIYDLVTQCREAGTKIYFKSNLGVSNRILELPMNLPIVQDPKQAPPEFHYLGKQ